MNIQGLQSTVTPAAPSRVGGRLDIRSDAPAQSHGLSPTAHTPPAQAAPPPSELEGASLLNVLNSQEQQALASAFGENKTPSYSGRGTTVSEPSILGTQLDLQA